jgi:hypothetical protein
MVIIVAESDSVKLPFPSAVMVKIKSIIGVTKPFLQGGSMRLTLPKELAKKIGPKIGKEYVGFIFLETDKGVLLVALDKTPNPGTVRDALSSFADIPRLNDEDLRILFGDE